MNNQNNANRAFEQNEWPDEVIQVNDEIVLHSASEQFVEPLYALVLKNRDWLQETMEWPRSVLSIDSTRKTVMTNYLLHHRHYTKMFMILQRGELVGVFSFNSIEPTNKTAYIGYWLGKESQGQGIVSAVIEAVIKKYVAEGLIRRFVIKCIVSNLASNRVALRNGFRLEGCLKQAEYLNDAFHDQNIYGRIEG